jgi:hypothetical protein
VFTPMLVVSIIVGVMGPVLGVVSPSVIDNSNYIFAIGLELSYQNRIKFIKFHPIESITIQ